MPAWARAAEARLLTGRTAPGDRLWLDPARVLTDAGLTPDPWQAAVLTSRARQLMLLWSRQVGKSTTVAGLALLTALREPPALVLLVARSLRQSGELFRKVQTLYHALGGGRRDRPAARRPRPVRALEREELLGQAGQAERETALQLELANGSRIVSLPGKLDTLVGFSGVALLVIDEAARVPDDVYYGMRPVLARSGGRIVLLSTPFGRRGFFYEEWQGPGPWERSEVKAEQCPHLAPAFLAEERRALGPRWYAQEYDCSFEAAAGSLFAAADIDAMLSPAADVLEFPAP